jgi:hypothetical protein
MQIESRVGPGFLEKANYKLQQLVTKGWLHSIWEFATTYKIKIQRPQCENAREWKNQNDSYIMKDVCSNSNWGIRELLKFNCCRLYLQVELISDIVTADGKQIRQQAWKGIKDEGHTNYVKNYFQQQRPGETAWSLWRRILKETYNCDDAGKLGRAIGPIQPTKDWLWFYHEPSDRLYKKKEQGWEVCSRLLQGRRTRTCQYGNLHLSNDIPSNVIPVTVYKKGEGFKIDGKGTDRIEQSFTRNIKWYETTTVAIKGALDMIVTSLQDNEVIIMWDGSEKTEMQQQHGLFLPSMHLL